MNGRVLIALLLLFGSCSSRPERQVAQRADALLVSGQLDAAMEVVDQYLQDHPDALEVRRHRVLIFLRAERFDLALPEIDRLPRGDPVWIQALNHADPGVRSSASRVLIDRPSAVSPQLVARKLADHSAEVRRNCARVTGLLKQSLFLKPLFRLLQDPDWQVRSEAVDALGAIGDPRAAGWLIVRLRDTDGFVQYRAAQALRAVVSEANHDAVVRAMQSPKQPHAFEIAVALAKLKDARVLGHLTNAVTNSETYVRRRAAEALGVCGQLSATNALLRLVADEEPTVRDEARIALTNLLVDKVRPH